MNVKEELIQVMGHIAEQFHTDRIAVIVCCEGEPQWCSVIPTALSAPSLLLSPPAK